MKSLSKEFYEDGYEDGWEAGVAEGLYVFIRYNFGVDKSGEQLVSEMISIFILSMAQAESDAQYYPVQFTIKLI